MVKFGIKIFARIRPTKKAVGVRSYSVARRVVVLYSHASKVVACSCIIEGRRFICV